MLVNYRDIQAHRAVKEFRLRIRTHPKLFRPEIFQDSGEPSDVILMGMSSYHDVKPGNASAPEVGGDKVFPRIQSRSARMTELQVSATVYQHFGAAREDYQKAIPLSDVDGSQFQQTRFPICAVWLPDQ